MGAKDLEKAEEQGLIEFFKLTTKISTSNMICFDLDGKIKKYSSPEEILDDFFPVRLAHYQKRKVGMGTLVVQPTLTLLQDYLANQLQMEHERLTNQARFVQMIVKKELSVSGRKKVEIVAELRKRGFRPFLRLRRQRLLARRRKLWMLIRRRRK